MKLIADRLWAKTEKRGPDDCWEWQGWRHPFGHGQIGRGRRSDGLAYTHVVAWEITNGPVPAGAYVCHRCDNPACVNPGHLFLGDHAANMKDMLAKRRNSFGERHATKLKDADVEAIRKALMAGVTQQLLANQFGVSRSMIGMIGRHQRWAISATDEATRTKLDARPLPGKSDMCGNGHLYSDVGFYRVRGGRSCKQCHRERTARYLARKAG